MTAASVRLAAVACAWAAAVFGGAWSEPASAALPDVPGAAFPLSGDATATQGNADAKAPMTLSANLAPLVKATGEARWEFAMGEKWSWSLMAGMGRGRSGAASLGWVAEGGVQVRRYLAGHFRRGLFLAAEADGLFAFGAGTKGEDALAVGPRLGYKVAGWWGLTLEGHIGTSYVRRTAQGLAPGSQVLVTELQPIGALLVGLTW